MHWQCSTAPRKSGLVYKAETSTRLGDHDKALEYLRRTSTDGMPCYPLFLADPHLRGLATDPRFVQFMAETKRRWEELAKTL